MVAARMKKKKGSGSRCSSVYL